MIYDYLRFESLCQSIEPLFLGEPGINFTCRPDKGSLLLMVQKGKDVATVYADRTALQQASSSEDLQGVAREALTRLRAIWSKEHPEFEQRPNPLDDAHSALWNRTREQPDQSQENRGEQPDTQAVYAGPGRGTAPLHPSSKYDDGQVNAADLGQYHTSASAAPFRPAPADSAHKRVDGNVDPARASSKYDDSDKDHHRDTTSTEPEHPKGKQNNPRGTEGGRDGSASTDTISKSVAPKK